MKTFIQIGTKDGNDEFRQMVLSEKPDIVILIEPNKSHSESIFLNYKDFPGSVFLENVAITAEPMEQVTLVRPAQVINGVEYDSGKYSILPMDDWGDDFIKMTVPAMTFSELCYKYDITHCDFLQIDTEGYDTEIIKSINFRRVTIDKIKYEIWHFPADRFTRHGEKGKQYGWAGMYAVEQLLTSKGYSFEYLPYDIIAWKTGI